MRGGTISLKTDYVAGQADGAVLATYGDTVVLVTAVSLKTIREGVDFLPLTVDYQEMTYAAGKIPGGFFKREGRLNEKEILTSRIIDRSIRPLFPKNYFHETQLMASVLSVDNENDSDVAAMLAASAALEISNIPFKGPIAGVRVGRVDGAFVCNPSQELQEKSDLNLFLVGRKIVPGTEGRPYDVNLVMMEGGSNEVDEEIDRRCDQLRSRGDAAGHRSSGQDASGDGQGQAGRCGSGRRRGPLCEGVRSWPFRDSRRGMASPARWSVMRCWIEVRKNVVQKLTAENPSLKPKVLEIIESLERRILREMILTREAEDRRPFQYGNPPDQLRGRSPAPRPRFGPLQPG